MQAGLLPVLRKTLRLPRLEYKSIMNQGDFLIEVPSEREDIPRVTCLVSAVYAQPVLPEVLDSCTLPPVSFASSEGRGCSFK